jgi:hypothetical protein
MSLVTDNNLLGHKKVNCVLTDVILMCFKSMKIKSVSVQTQLNSIYYIELHDSTYLRSSSGTHLVLKHTEEEIYIM